MPIGSYRFTTSRKRATSTTRSATSAHRRLEILQLHDLAPIRRRVGTENHLQHVDALDLRVERSPVLTQAGDEVDDLQGVGVRLRRAGLLGDGLLTTPRFEEQRATVAP